MTATAFRVGTTVMRDPMIEPIYDLDNIKVFQGDSRDVLPQLPDECVELVVTDPPYGKKRQTNETNINYAKESKIKRQAFSKRRSKSR